MEIEEKKERLLRKEISIYDLDSDEIEKIKKNIEEDITIKRAELNDINKKIMQMKVEIDNWKK